MLGYDLSGFLDLGLFSLKEEAWKNSFSSFL
jgi:hypothetical protein